MEISRVCLLFITALGSTVLPSYSFANVFVCKDDNCQGWTPITDAQYSIASSDGNTTTIRQALSGASEESVRNGYNNTSNTDLYLKNSMWHPGGITPFEGGEHVTAYVYKSTDPGTLLKTCHIFSVKNPKGAYHATCVKAQ